MGPISSQTSNPGYSCTAQRDTGPEYAPVSASLQQTPGEGQPESLPLCARECQPSESASGTLQRYIIEQGITKLHTLPAGFCTPGFILSLLQDSCLSEAGRQNICEYLIKIYIPEKMSSQQDFSLTGWLANTACHPSSLAHTHRYTIDSDILTQHFAFTSEIPNHALEGLEKALLVGLDLQLPNAAIGRELKQYVERQARIHADALKVTETKQGFPEDCKVYGGRSFSTMDKSTGMQRYFKLQMKDEAWETMVREQTMHQFCQSNELPLKSEIPIPCAVFRIRKKDISPELLETIEAPLKEHEIDGDAWLCGYEFLASKDYQQYCVDDIEPTQYVPQNITDVESGLMKAVADLGFWASSGILHTSILPIYHSYVKEPSRNIWHIFPNFVGYKAWSQNTLPGLIIAGDRAVKRSDLGVSGLRDLGDFESYGHVSSYIINEEHLLDYQDCWLETEFEEEESILFYKGEKFKQKACVVNCIGNNLFGVLLTYAFAHCEDAFHYKNPEAIVSTEQFLEKVLETFARSFLNRPFSFRSAFSDTETYSRWLNLSSRELLLWTTQKTLSTGELNPGSVYNHKKLDSTLYPVPNAQDIVLGESYYLGLRSKVMPMVTFIQGLTFFCEKLVLELSKA